MKTLLRIGAAAPLLFGVAQADIDLESFVGEIDGQFEALSELLPNRFEFTDGETGNNIPDGGDDMYDGGNFLNTNLQEQLAYTGGEVVTTEAFGPGSSYVTIKKPGMFIMAASSVSVSQFYITGDTGADGGGAVDAYSYTTSIGGQNVRVSVKQTYDSNDPSINQIIIAPGSPDATQDFSEDSNSDSHILSGIQDSSVLFYVLFARGEGEPQVPREEIEDFVNEFAKFGVSSQAAPRCVVRNEQAYCWGRNDLGQLGLGDIENRGDQPGEMANLPAINLGRDFAVASLSYSNMNTCAASTEGAVKCWGFHEEGRLGYPHTEPQGDGPGEMGRELQEVDLGAGFRAAKVFVGDNHSCALSRDDRLKCWGFNEFGQLGLEDTESRGDDAGEMGEQLPYVNFGPGARVLDVALGQQFTCVLLGDQSVRCFGDGSGGALGNGFKATVGDEAGEMGASLLPVVLSDKSAPQKIEAGAGFACALLASGKVHCWGESFAGQLGTGERGEAGGDPDEPIQPVRLGSGQLATGLTCGGGHCCVVLVQNTMKCWGSNGSGQLGLGDTSNRGQTPETIGDNLPFVYLNPLSYVQKAEAVANTTCVTIDDELTCWGLNSYGQLGQGDLVNRGGTQSLIPIAIDPINLP